MTTTAVPFAYTDIIWPIPERTADGHRRSWERLAAAGEWWSGAERISIAAETRRAGAMVDGLPDPGPGPADLPEAAVHAVQRLIGDLPNVSREWYEEIVSAPGMSDAHYIELLGVVVQVWAIDEIHRALSLPLEPLPEPQAGAPTQSTTRWSGRSRIVDAGGNASRPRSRRRRYLRRTPAEPPT